MSLHPPAPPVRRPGARRATVLLAVLLLVVSACGDRSVDDETPGTASSPTEPDPEDNDGDGDGDQDDAGGTDGEDGDGHDGGDEDEREQGGDESSAREDDGSDEDGDGEPAPEVELAALTEDHGCGYGFATGSSDQRVGLFVHPVDPPSGQDAADELGIPGGFDLAGDTWDAHVEIGRDLFSNWCDDVIEADEPTPETDERWTVTQGKMVIEVADPVGGCEDYTAELTDLVARPPGGSSVELGDIEVTNNGWGCLAG